MTTLDTTIAKLETGWTEPVGNPRAASAPVEGPRPAGHHTVDFVSLISKISRADWQLLRQISNRAWNASEVRIAYGNQPLGLLIDLIATHALACPLRLADLADAAEHDFCHDLFGIRNCLDRNTNQLTSGFLPRYAAPAASAEAEP